MKLLPQTGALPAASLVIPHNTIPDYLSVPVQKNSAGAVRQGQIIVKLATAGNVNIVLDDAKPHVKSFTYPYSVEGKEILLLILLHPHKLGQSPRRRRHSHSLFKYLIAKLLLKLWKMLLLSRNIDGKERMTYG